MKSIFFLFVFFSTYSLNAQSVIGSGGQSGASNTIYASATIGEAIIGSATSQSHYSNQGFQQALDPEYTSVLEINSEIYKINLSPNPTTESLNIKLDKPTESKIMIRILNINGALYNSMYLDKGTKDYTLDINNLTPGIYLLSIQSEHGISSNAYRFIKL